MEKSFDLFISQFSEINATLDSFTDFEKVIRNGGGSKLNEVTRAYTDIAPKINQYEKFKFVWITDGQGWLLAKNKLGEAYSLIPSIYNLANIGSS